MQVKIEKNIKAKIKVRVEVKIKGKIQIRDIVETKNIVMSGPVLSFSIIHQEVFRRARQLVCRLNVLPFL